MVKRSRRRTEREKNFNHPNIKYFLFKEVYVATFMGRPHCRRSTKPKGEALYVFKSDMYDNNVMIMIFFSAQSNNVTVISLSLL